MTTQKCMCDCGEPVAPGQSWRPGHDHRAVHQRIKRDYGSVAAFIEEYDKQHPRRPAARKRTAAKA